MKLTENIRAPKITYYCDLNDPMIFYLAQPSQQTSEASCNEQCSLYDSASGVLDFSSQEYFLHLSFWLILPSKI